MKKEISSRFPELGLKQNYAPFISQNQCPFISQNYAPFISKVKRFQCIDSKDQCLSHNSDKKFKRLQKSIIESIIPKIHQHQQGQKNQQLSSGVFRSVLQRFSDQVDTLPGPTTYNHNQLSHHTFTRKSYPKKITNIAKQRRQSFDKNQQYLQKIEQLKIMEKQKEIMRNYRKNILDEGRLYERSKSKESFSKWNQIQKIKQKILPSHEANTYRSLENKENKKQISKFKHIYQYADQSKNKMESYKPGPGDYKLQLNTLSLKKAKGKRREFQFFDSCQIRFKAEVKEKGLSLLQKIKLKKQRHSCSNLLKHQNRDANRRYHKMF